MANPTTGDVRVVTSEQAAVLVARVLESHTQKLVDKLHKWVETQESTYEIVDVAVADFENQGAYTLFASVVTQYESGFFGSDLYYITGSDMRVIKELDMGSASSFTNIVAVGQDKFLVNRGPGVSGWRESMYGVKNGQVYETNVSGRGMLLRGNEYGELLIAHSTFDAGVDGTGHTYKPYYFYLDSNGDFREYGGIPINLEQIRALDDTLVIPPEYRDEDISTAYYRENGIIHINYTINGTHQNLTYRRESDRLSLLENDEDRGVYLAAFMGDLATYPRSLPTVE